MKFIHTSKVWTTFRKWKGMYVWIDFRAVLQLICGNDSAAFSDC